MLDLGTADGEEPYLFDRVENAVRLGDGTIVVANAGTQQIRWFDSTGRFVRTVGRKGGGPGEFGVGSRMHLWVTPEGRLAADDHQARRAHLLDLEGRFLATMSPAWPSRARMPQLAGAFEDGRWLVRSYLDPEFEGDGAHLKWDVVLSLHAPDGSLIRELPTVPGPAVYAAGSGPERSFFSVPFVTESMAAISGGEVMLSPAR